MVSTELGSWPGLRGGRAAISGGSFTAVESTSRPLPGPGLPGGQAAALGSFRDFGLSRITMEDVASRAGLSRQSVYRYFPSKDTLIVALVSREEEKFLDGVKAAFVEHADLELALRTSVRFVLQYAREH